MRRMREKCRLSWSLVESGSFTIFRATVFPRVFDDPNWRPRLWETRIPSPKWLQLIPRKDWAHSSLRLPQNIEKAAFWAKQAAGEHASVAAFAKLTCN